MHSYVVVLFPAFLHHDGMCVSCRNSHSKHCLYFLLLSGFIKVVVQVQLWQPAALKKKQKKTSISCCQLRWPITTNNRKDSHLHSVCLSPPSLPSLLLKCGKIAWSNYSRCVLSPVFFPYYNHKAQGVLMESSHKLLMRQTRNVCADSYFFSSFPEMTYWVFFFSCF